MTWTRLDDTWTDQPMLADLAYEVRWHYLAMIQFCSRTKRYDGVLKMSDARRCSDVDDPVQAIQILVAADLVALLDDKRVKVGRIDEHIPPPGVRENSAKSKVRMQRHRKHKNGDHSECLSEHCDQAPGVEAVNTVTGEVTGDVTRNTGTGQDRTGQDYGSAQNDVSQRHEDQSEQFDLEEQMNEEIEVEEAGSDPGPADVTRDSSRDTDSPPAGPTADEIFALMGRWSA